MAVAVSVVRDGWEVSGRRADGPLRLADRCALAKVLVRADTQGSTAERLGVRHGRTRRNDDGVLVVGSRPGEWLLIGAPGSAAHLADAVPRTDGELVTVLDLTHGRALLRLTGAHADATLAKLCGIDFADRTTPNGTALTSAVARVATDLVRDDVADTRSYLLHVERSVGQHLFDTLLNAGREFGIELDGFVYPEE